MPQYNDDDDLDLDDLQGDDLVKNLRKHIRKLERELGERDERITELAQATRATTVGQMLESFGLSARIARYVADDVQTEDDLIEWLDEYGEDFGISPVDSSDEDDPDAQMAALMSAAEEGGYDPAQGYDLMAQIQAAEDPDQLLALLRSS